MIFSNICDIICNVNIVIVIRVGSETHSFALVMTFLERNDEMAGKKVTDTVFDLANPIALSHGCFVDDVEFKKEGADYVLRVIIDVDDSSDGGVSIDQCENVSRALSDILDEADPIAQAYMLEVSSPGIDRELKREKDFVRFMGREVDIKLYKAIDGVKLLSGKLIAYSPDAVTIESDGGETTVAMSDAASVRLAVIW